jgi:hypothetical protein
MKKKTPPGRRCEYCQKSTGATTWYGYGTTRRLLHPRCARLEKQKADKEIDKIIKKHGGLDNLNDALMDMGIGPL